MSSDYAIAAARQAVPRHAGRSRRPVRTIVLFFCLLAVLFVTACATTPTGRRQLKLMDPSRMEQMGNQAYGEIKKETPEVKDKEIRAYVRCVSTAVTSALPRSDGTTDWKVTVFQKDDMVNAFALPGGNIGIYTGLLEVAETPDQLAAVISHEIAHVRMEHANARISASYATMAGVGLVGAIIGVEEERDRRLLSLLGLGAQIGVILPYNRSQETEADVLGLEYMAAAGFNPRASIALWRNMQEAGGQGPPEFLSTHPSKGRRIDTLQRNLPEALERYREARERGNVPDCRPPGKQ